MRIRDGWLGRQLRRFARSNDGAAALEFALVLPPLCIILVGMFEMSILMFTQASMEGALREAARFGMTGSVSDPAARQTQILAIIDKDTFGFVPQDEATISFLIYPSFGDVNQPEPFTDKNGNGTYEAGIDQFTASQDINGNGVWDGDQGTAGVGAAAQIVQYTVQYDWHVITPFMAPIFGNNGKVHLKASIVLRNEPWDATSSSS
ncbi:MAG TPA: TadE/TadG family type IV pilus assembly protein [Candidatus Acidoferrum sp.]|nr:TadE/TadG family type IV pilus assembly protein [Candidatus Acidoferrum sp.]